MIPIIAILILLRIQTNRQTNPVLEVLSDLKTKEYSLQ